MAQTVCVIFSALDRERLLAIVADSNRRQKHVEWARIVLASADRKPVQRVAQSIGVNRPMVWRWQQRLAEARVERLLRDQTRKSGKPPIVADKAARMVALTCTEPPYQATHWTAGRWVSRCARCNPLAGAPVAAASSACFQELARSGLSGEARRHRRPLYRSTDACRVLSFNE
jgi:hypothetical protein